MTEFLAVLAVAVLFVVFVIAGRGRSPCCESPEEDPARCAGCPSRSGHEAGRR